ncbi:MAG TPA: aminotransferase class I/II-fold pyridoxal phosphate-dependent enzyme [Vicinamibacterales bacterium]|nr:aminotransferase class I/II-fold pyridoxal phosphate-dependent enzyme [Vicinamibacterales bacterium]
MLTAISRYGARVLPMTQELIAEVEGRGEFIEGPQIAEFERAFAARFGDARAVSASYGRMAFYYILKALNFPAGAEIVIPALTFWVIPEIARVAGLTPVFADVDPATFNVTPATIARAITPKTVAVVPTHLWGLPCDMDGILELAHQHKLVVIEDCAHALGALYRGQPVGTIGDAALFSFQTLKPLNTYGGGMAVTRDRALGDRIAALVAAEPPPTVQMVKKRLWHGRVQRISIRPRVFTWTLFPILRAGAMFGTNPDVYLWEKIRPLDPLPEDYRARYSNVQAVMGLEALKLFDRWTAETQAHAARITAALSGVSGVRLPVVPPDRTHVFYQYCAYMSERDTVVLECLRHGVDLETLHVDVCAKMDLFAAFAAAAPGAEETEQALQIPVYESLTAGELERVASVVRRVAERQTSGAVAVTARG